MLHAIDRGIEVLIAEPGSVGWIPISGRFTEEQSNRIDPVKGCHENDGTELAFSRAWAREGMKIFTEKTIQPGKASPKLECAYVIAGREEKKVKVTFYSRYCGTDPGPNGSHQRDTDEYCPHVFEAAGPQTALGLFSGVRLPP